MRRKSSIRAAEAFFILLMRLSTLFVLACLILIVGTILIKGIGAMSLDMITRSPSGGFYLGREGGVLNAIVGSCLLTTAATGIAFMISVPLVLSINLFTRKGSHFASWVRMSLDLLWGTPSIVYGAFGFILLIALGIPSSLLGGIITVAILILPIMARAMDEVVSMVPPGLREASYSLGANRTETAFGVVLRQAAPGMASALLIAFGRGIGDAASVLFTAGFSDAIPRSLLQPAATLPLAIFFQLASPLPEVQARAHASALILIIIILVASISARLIARRLNRHIIR